MFLILVSLDDDDSVDQSVERANQSDSDMQEPANSDGDDDDTQVYFIMLSRDHNSKYVIFYLGKAKRPRFFCHQVSSERGKATKSRRTKAQSKQSQ